MKNKINKSFNQDSKKETSTDLNALSTKKMTFIYYSNYAMGVSCVLEVSGSSYLGIISELRPVLTLLTGLTRNKEIYTVVLCIFLKNQFVLNYHISITM